MAADKTRRALLTAAALLPVALAGCKAAGIQALGPVPTPAPDVAVLDQAIAAERLLVATYHAAGALLPAGSRAAAAVTAIMAEHEAHLTALRSQLLLPARLRGAPARSPQPGSLPQQPTALLAALVADEQAAAQRMLADLSAVPSRLAQIMASIGASEAAHVVVLARAGRP